ncbi:MAG: MATE family efflux transporter [Bacteroidota bacterium]
MANHSASLGTQSISRLLIKQAVPASIGILVMSIYGIVDTIFVGRFVGGNGIAAITVVMPITFLIGSIGMAIGVGGGSIISRALGAGEGRKACITFGNQITLTMGLSILIVSLGWIFQDQVLALYGGKGEVLAPAREYYRVVLLGVPFLAWAMMSNNIIRAEGEPRMAMYSMILPAVTNMILDPIFIVGFDMGMAGAGYATVFGYASSAALSFWFFSSGRSELSFYLDNFRLRWAIVKEIFAIGGVTMARQGAISLLSIVLNNMLFAYGQETALTVYGMISRTLMFANFPVVGLIQGFLPIAGYNYGAKKYDRVKETIKLSILSGTVISFMIFTSLMLFTRNFLSIYTEDEQLLAEATPALRIVFFATPLLCMQLIGSAFYQAIGKALPALLLALAKQGICLIPLLLILPSIFGLEAIWWSFPIADVLAATLSYIFLRIGTAKRLGGKVQSVAD